MSRKALLLYMIGLVAALQATPAAPQVPGPPNPSSDSSNSSNSSNTLEEITITARKREESFLDVPVVADMITQQTLQQSSINDLTTLATRVPGMLLGTGVISTGTQISLRGIGTTAIDTTIDQSVALNIDGLALSQGLAYGIGLFNIQQVEVLKGPQALFFGKNNTAGVISLRGTDPTDQVETTARAGYETEAGEKQIRSHLFRTGYRLPEA